MDTSPAPDSAEGEEELHLLGSELRKFTKWLAHSTGPAYVANAVRSMAGISM